MWIIYEVFYFVKFSFSDVHTIPPPSFTRDLGISIKFLVIYNLLFYFRIKSNFGLWFIMLLLWLIFWPIHSCPSFHCELIAFWWSFLQGLMETVIFPICSYLWNNGEKGGIHGIDDPYRVMQRPVSSYIWNSDSIQYKWLYFSLSHLS